MALAARMLDASRAKRLTVTWFGGEPLIATDVIEALSPRLISLAEERGCDYKAWVFTNGYLLDEDVVDLLLRCRVTNIHIPLDGVGATNDATRRLQREHRDFGDTLLPVGELDGGRLVP